METFLLFGMANSDDYILPGFPVSTSKSIRYQSVIISKKNTHDTSHNKHDADCRSRSAKENNELPTYLLALAT